MRKLTDEERKVKYKANYEANKDKILARAKAKYEANKSTILDKQKAYYIANKEQIMLSRKVYYQDNKEQCQAYSRAYSKAYYEANREKKKLYHQLWRYNNLQKYRLRHDANKSLRQQRLILATPSRPLYDNKAVNRVRLDCYKLINSTGVDHEVDHIDPIGNQKEDGKTLICGLHVAHNMQILTSEENNRKHAKFKPYGIDADGNRYEL